MNCEQARALLTEDGSASEGLAEHLAACPACAGVRREQPVNLSRRNGPPDLGRADNPYLERMVPDGTPSKSSAQVCPAPPWACRWLRRHVSLTWRRSAGAAARSTMNNR